MTFKNRKSIHVFIFYISFFLTFVSNAQIKEKELDNLIEKTRTTFDVPGISVGILKDGKIIYAKGHGVRSLNNKKEMNEKYVGWCCVK